MEQQKILADLLHRLADCIEHISRDEIEELLSGRMALTHLNELSKEKHLERRPVRRAAKKLEEPTAKELAFVNRLREFASRDEGLDMLEGAKLNKRDLERLARLMDLPVLREDDAEKLRQKIVEASIGSRLNSRAIRGA
jgi:hypothetical protein